MKRIVILLLLAVGLVNCGGGGNGDPLRSLLDAYIGALNARNLPGAMVCYSDSYLNNCETKGDVEAQFGDLLSTPGLTFHFSNVHVTASSNDGQTGEIIGTLHYHEDDNGVITEADGSFDLVGRVENGIWRIYGNQQCNNRPPKAIPGF